MTEEKPKKPWYKTWWGIIILICIWPVTAIAWIWKRNISRTLKMVFSLPFFIFLIFTSLLVVIASDAKPGIKKEEGISKPQEASSKKIKEVSPIPTENIESTPKPTVYIPTVIEKVESQPVQETKSETVSQKNAVAKAKSYLNYSAFSHDGLVDQLEYEQFSHSDAVYGADNSGADWNEQAAKKAKSYMEYSAFSRGGLIDQLLYEKFTREQAEYGANSVGL